MCSRSTPTGIYFNGPGPATDWNVFIYTDNGGLPGTQIYSATNQPVSVVGTTFTVNLTPAAVLAAGTYWIEIQANMTFGTQGEWGWTDRTVQSNSAAAWQNPGGGFGVWPTWVRKRQSAFRPQADPIKFTGLTERQAAAGRRRLPRQGHLPGALPIPLAPARALSRLATLTPATIATIAQLPFRFPFPVSVYGQTFNTTMSPRTELWT